MTLEEINKRVKEIADDRYDDDQKHRDEDRLRADFIKYIAEFEGLPDGIAEKARLVLTTDNLDFSRWYA